MQYREFLGVAAFKKLPVQIAFQGESINEVAPLLKRFEMGDEANDFEIIKM